MKGELVFCSPECADCVSFGPFFGEVGYTGDIPDLLEYPCNCVYCLEKAGVYVQESDGNFVKVYTEAEFMAEKPKGRLILCAESGYWRVFQCHGCQTCWDYDDDTDTISQAYPHLLSMERIDIDALHPEREYLVQPQDAV